MFPTWNLRVHLLQQKKLDSIRYNDVLKNKDAILLLCTHLCESLEVLTCKVSLSLQQCRSFGRNLLLLPVVGVGLIRNLTGVTLVRICSMYDNAHLVYCCSTV